MTNKQDEHIKEIVEETISENQDETPVYETVDKITPGMHDISWWIKWVSTICMIFGGLLIQSNVLFAGTIFGAIGVLGWTWVGMLWNDHAIILMNAMFLGIYLLSITSKILIIFGG